MHKRASAERYILGVLVILFSWLLLGSLFSSVVSAIFFPELPQGISTHPDSSISSPALFTILMASFIPFLLGCIITVRTIIGTSLSSFCSSRDRFSISRTVKSGGIWILLMTPLSVLEMLLRPESFSLQFSPGPFLRLLPLALVLVPIQVFSEELLFRAYLWRWSRRVTQSVILPALFSGVLFTFAHAGNPETALYSSGGLLYLYYFLFGLILMLFTLRDGGIEMATGIHLGNNLFTVLLINYEGSALPTPAIFLVEEIRPLLSILYLLVSSALLWYLMIRRPSRSS